MPGLENRYKRGRSWGKLGLGGEEGGGFGSCGLSCSDTLSPGGGLLIVPGKQLPQGDSSARRGGMQGLGHTRERES